jgi:hypothetical protein
VEMDARADIQGPSLKELELYCDRVACAVGRLCVRIFGMNDADGKALAHHLGRALQLTNILRDIDEDAAVGRLYLPKEALALANIETTDPTAVASSPQIGAACAFIVERAREHFTKATSGRAGAKNNGRGVSPDARRHGIARLGPATEPCPRQQILFIVDRFAACIRLTQVQSTLLERVWRGLLPPSA